MPWLAACSLFVSQAGSSFAPEATPRVVDPELRRAIALVEEGDYPGGLRAIDASLRRLRAVPGRSRDRALGHLYAGMALIAQGKTSSARGRFREALEEHPSLTLSTEAFPPKVTDLFRSARADGVKTAATGWPRMIQSASGSAGAMHGSSFKVEEPRSIFHMPDDRRAVVSFEWHAPPGVYRLVGAWRDPQGRHAPQPEVVLESRGPRMTTYWILELTASTAPGQWTLEVTQDGRSVGQHAIQVLGPPAREQESERDDLFARVRPSLVIIEKRDGEGLTFGRGMGFLVSGHRVATAFQVVDGARSLLLRLSDGRSLVSDRLTAWDRWQDWALLDVTATGLPGLQVADGPLPNGQRYRLLDLDSGDQPYLARPVVALPMSLSGRAGERLTLGVADSVADTGFRLALAQEAVGGPVLDARGQVVAIVGGSVVPGEATADSRLGLSATMATPVSLVSNPSASATRLEQLIASGESLEPAQSLDLTRAAMLRGPGVPAEGSSPADETTEFSRSDGPLLVWAVFEPRQARKVSLRTRIYDLNGVLQAETGAVRKELTLGRAETVSWAVDVAGLPSGAYRTDVLLDAQCVWRGFFRLIE